MVVGGRSSEHLAQQMEKKGGIVSRKVSDGKVFEYIFFIPALAGSCPAFPVMGFSEVQREYTCVCLVRTIFDYPGDGISVSKTGRMSFGKSF